MKFSHFVKMGGHTFNLLQNKDLLELFGLVKPGVQNYLKKLKESPAQSQKPQVVIHHWIPTHYPTPIDSPHWSGHWMPPYGHMPHGARPPYRLTSAARRHAGLTQK